MRLAAALALLTLALPTAAQGRWTDTFAVPGLYMEDAYGLSAGYAATPDGDGVLVGGRFDVVDSVEAHGVGRWTGSGWEAFGGGLRGDLGSPGVAFDVVRDGTGAVWVAGQFVAVVQPDGSTLAADGLARWTGTAWDVPGRLENTTQGAGAPVGYALVVQGGSVYVAGSFSDLVRPDGTRIGGGGVARWTAGAWDLVDGSGRVLALAAAPEGGVLFAGAVTDPSGFPATGIVRADGGTVQPYSGAFEGFAEIHSLLVADGVLTIGGYFQRAFADVSDYVSSRNVIQWNGQAWRPLGGGVDYIVRALATDAAGDLLVGGIFRFATQPDDTQIASPGLVRWTGAQWAAADVPGDPGRVEALARVGSETIVGGAIELRSGTGAATVRATAITVRSDAGAFRPLSRWTGRDGLSTFAATTPSALARTGCGGLRRAGLPGAVGPLPAGPVRTWDGQAWADGPSAVRDVVVLPPGPEFPPLSYVVSTAAPVPGSCEAFVLGGRFSGVRVGDAVVASANVVRFDGQAWQPLGRGTDGVVAAVAVRPDGRIVVGGQFTQVFQADGTPIAARNVAEWMPGAGWSSLAGGVIERWQYGLAVRDLLLDADGSVVVVGDFDAVLGAAMQALPARSVARWTGAAWETFGGPDTAPTAFYAVTAVERLGGDLVVGGDFQTVVQPDGSAVAARSVAAWDGQAWRALAGLDAGVSDLDVGGGTLFAASDDVFAWMGSAWRPLDSGTGGGVARLVATDETLFASGAFAVAGGLGSPGLAAFDLDGIVATDAPASAETGAFAVFPNPARTSVTLRLRPDAPGPVRITLLDALGRTVAVVMDGEAAAGEQTLAVDVSRLPAGIYVARVAAGGRVQTQRLTVVR